MPITKGNLCLLEELRLNCLRSGLFSQILTSDSERNCLRTSVLAGMTWEESPENDRITGQESCQCIVFL